MVLGDLDEAYGAEAGVGEAVATGPRVVWGGVAAVL